MFLGDPTFLSITNMGILLRERKISPTELTRSFLNRIDRMNPKLGAYITISHEDAIAAAKLAEKEIASGHYRSPLHGIPIAVKDIIDSEGVRTTSGSRILKDRIPLSDATVLARLKNAGAVLIGKLQCSEFAAGDDENPITGSGPVRNAWHANYSAGTSSSGSGTAVAANLCAAALGTDTGGSIRNPSAFNGVVGMKPTFGRVSRHGVTPLSVSLDHVGPMTKSVEDNALVLELMSGLDPKDPWSSARPVYSFKKNIEAGVRGLKLGIPKRFFFEYATTEIVEAVFEAARELEKQGALLQEIDLPHLRFAVGAEFAILLPEAIAYHRKYLDQGRESEYSQLFRYGVLEPAKTVNHKDYTQAQRIRKCIIHDFEEAFSKVDAMLAPGAEGAATSYGEEDFAKYKTPGGERELLEMWTRIYFPANLSGVPSLVLPCGFSKTGLPLSLAIMGKHFDEQMVYRVGHTYEKKTRWHTYQPNA